MMCNRLRWAVLAVGLGSFGAWAGPSEGAPAVFFDRDDNNGNVAPFPKSQAKFNQFVGTLGLYGVEDVELIDSGPPTFGVNPTLVFGGTGITATSNGVLAQSAPTFQIGTQALVELDAAAPGQVNTLFHFNQHITAFGAFVIQGGDDGLPGIPTTNDNLTMFRLKDTVANTSVDVPVQIGPHWAFNNIFFVGVTDTVPFNEVEILESIDVNDGMLYDNIVAGNVPEPGTLVLMMLGGAGALCRARRFRRG